MNVFGRTVPIGACHCPGEPHPEGDWITIKPRLSFGDIRYIRGALGNDTGLAEGRLFQAVIIDWNRVNEKGDKLNINLPSIDSLEAETYPILVSDVENSPEEKYWTQLGMLQPDEPAKELEPLPNGPSGPSEAGLATTAPPPSSKTKTT